MLVFYRYDLPSQVLGSSRFVKCLDNSCSIHQQERPSRKEMDNYFGFQATSRRKCSSEAFLKSQRLPILEFLFDRSQVFPHVE